MLPASIYFLTGSTFGFLVGVLAATWQRGGDALEGTVDGLHHPGRDRRRFRRSWSTGCNIPTPVFVDRAVALMAGALDSVDAAHVGDSVGRDGAPAHRPACRGVEPGAPTRHAAAGDSALAGVFAITGVERSVGIIQTAMPAAVLTSLIALEHDLIPDFVTTVVLFSTLASAVTLTDVLALV
jgi:hypothetical protein